MPDLLHVALFLVLGAIIGALGALFGIGGGLIAIPLLSLAFGLDQQHAQGTALAMVAPNVLIGLWNYAQHRDFDRRVALLMAAAAVPFTFLGAFVAVHVSGAALRIAFGCFLAVIAITFAIRALRVPRRASARSAIRYDWRWTAPIGAIGGALSGIFSVGGAVFAVPMLSVFWGYGQATAQGLSLGLVAPGTVVSILTYAHAGDVAWGIGLPLAAGGMFSVRYGVRLAHRLPERTLRLLFSVLIAASSAALLLRR